MFGNLKNFLKMTILGGLFVLLPIALFVYIIYWAFGLFVDVFAPLSIIYSDMLHISIYLGHILSLVTLIGVCFFVGVVTMTQLGNIFHYYIDSVLNKIPGYAIINDTFKQFFGKDKKSFTESVLIDRLDNGILESGFVTDSFTLKGIEYKSVFIPTGPNPTSGFIIHIPRDKIIKQNDAIDKTMKSIISCGAGTSKIWGDE